LLFLGIPALVGGIGRARRTFNQAGAGLQDKMEIVFSMCIGSAIQIALVVAPVLVLASW
jgi:Ca2+:H+ antiporter